MGSSMSCTAQEARTREFQVDLDPAATAVIVVDMWDTHWCKTFAAWTHTLAPRLNQALHGFRELGFQVIHAAANVVVPYRDTPQYLRAHGNPDPGNIVAGEPLDPVAPGRWPMGGCVCPGGENCGQTHLWTRIHPDVDIADDDLITEHGHTVHAICTARGFDTLLYCGICTNMCVLDTRSFSMVHTIATGYRVMLLRDLTEAFVPKIYRDEGTRLAVRYIERFVAPTILASQLLGQKEKSK